jgi:cysteine desulfurase
MKRRSVYLDNAASTALDPLVLEAMTACLGAGGAYANPSSTHSAGREALTLIEAARTQVARRVQARAAEIVFTSGATESNNLALHGVLRARPAPAHLLTTRIEHPSVLDTAKALAASGVEVSYLDCDVLGLIDPEQVRAALRDNTALVSVMHINNEIGVVQPIAQIGAVCRERGVLLHVDAAQSAGKIDLALETLPVDLASLSAHKLHGPKGVGALYVRSGLALEPLLRGGGQERGRRPGTLPTHQIVGMGAAFELADPAVHGLRLASFRSALLAGLAGLEGVHVNGCTRRCAPHILNVSFAGVEGESLRLALSDLAVSPGSACASDVDEPSHVLSSLGLSDTAAQSSLRFSVGRFTSQDDIDYALARIATELDRLRGLAPSAPTWCRSP